MDIVVVLFFYLPLHALCFSNITCFTLMQRITADDALNHPWFQEVPLPKSKDFMPTFPAQHAQDRYLEIVFKLH